MDNKLLGNFIIAFPTAAYLTYNAVMAEANTEIDFVQYIITALIAFSSYIIGSKIKKKGEVK
ncbi:hypothetical protein [uncultured Winogradskyella sp.]|uniref:hypothetical protein n=1 Tax=uncultured Winogradskyella sp. TaxID=395353 RepID=UPI00262FACA9|nr:hypothetical protein [uncultured Winogradskyella sp.]|tara:strand:+ start:693 stop:878 length:186 start_codon:yes stop_codon:yes gene_type:complete